LPFGVMMARQAANGTELETLRTLPSPSKTFMTSCGVDVCVVLETQLANVGIT
jgi:hypothetical protein